MSNHVAPRLTSSYQSSYKDPLRNQTDYRFYNPQLFVPSIDKYQPDKGTKKWFHDYRRSTVAEQTMKNNLKSMPTPLRPTYYSDKPDIVLGFRKEDRESLLPVIHNNPVYNLTQRIPDRERDRDKRFMSYTQTHRDQMRDPTGSLHKKHDFFYHPFPSEQTFSTRQRSTDKYMSHFPGEHTAANEFVYAKKRAKPLVDHNTTDVCM